MKATMRPVYQAFPNCDALRHELSRTRHRSFLQVEDAAARVWYMNETAAQNWNAARSVALFPAHQFDQI